MKYQNGELVPRNKRAVYLGTILTDKNENKTEIANRIADATAVANKLKLFWNKAENDDKWKITVYNAVSRSKLLYGLECLELTQPEKDRLDAFQIKGLRRRLHIPPTHIDRSTTNEMVMEKAAMVLEKLEPITRFQNRGKIRNLNYQDTH